MRSSEPEHAQSGTWDLSSVGLGLSKQLLERLGHSAKWLVSSYPSCEILGSMDVYPVLRNTVEWGEAWRSKWSESLWSCLAGLHARSLWPSYGSKSLGKHCEQGGPECTSIQQIIFQNTRKPLPCATAWAMLNRSVVSYGSLPNLHTCSCSWLDSKRKTSRKQTMPEPHPNYRILMYDTFPYIYSMGKSLWAHHTRVFFFFSNLLPQSWKPTIF